MFWSSALACHNKKTLSGKLITEFRTEPETDLASFYSHLWSGRRSSEAVQTAVSCGGVVICLPLLLLSASGDSGLNQFPGDHADHISLLQGKEAWQRWMEEVL